MQEKHAAQFVHDECRERFTFDIFRHEQQRAPTLRHFFQQRDKIVQVRNLFLGQKNERDRRAPLPSSPGW